MNDQRTRSAFDFLQSHDGAQVTVAEIAEAAGWTESTVRTYIAKHWKPWLRQVGTGQYRVQQFGSVPYSLFLARQSQVKAAPGVPPDLAQRIELALRTDESQEFEFKEVPPSDRSSRYKLAEELAAFATSNDGLVLLGVTNGRTVVGLPGADTSEEQARIREVIENAADMVRPRISVSITFVELGDGWVAAIEVRKGREPVYYVGGKPYVRTGSRSRPAEPDEVKQLILDAQGDHPIPERLEELMAGIHRAEEAARWAL